MDEIPNFYEKYMSEIEAHAGIIIQICKDYSKEVGKALAEQGVCDKDIASAEAEKTMLLGVLRYILDCYMEGGEWIKRKNIRLVAE